MRLFTLLDCFNIRRGNTSTVRLRILTGIEVQGVLHNGVSKETVFGESLLELKERIGGEFGGVFNLFGDGDELAALLSETVGTYLVGLDRELVRLAFELFGGVDLIVVVRITNQSLKLG